MLLVLYKNVEPTDKVISDFKFIFELCLRGDPYTLLLSIYDDKDPSPVGKTLESIESVKEFPQYTLGPSIGY